MNPAWRVALEQPAASLNRERRHSLLLGRQHPVMEIKLCKDFCYICASPLPSPKDQTIDHVVPKGLFEKKKGLIELPTHKACNNSFSQDDEYFRLCMAAAAAPRDPLARKMWESPVMRGFHRPEMPGLKKATLKALHHVDVHTPAGIYLGTSEAMFQDASRIPLDWPVSSDLINHAAAKKSSTFSSFV